MRKTLDLIGAIMASCCEITPPFLKNARQQKMDDETREMMAIIWQSYPG
jgi:hypothetical protein